MKRLLTIIILITLVLGIAGNSLAENKETKISINVEPMQELKVTKETAITFTYPWEGIDNGQPLVFNDVGETNIRSNVNWALNINSLQVYRELEIWVRPSGTYNAKWQQIDRINGLFTGKSGMSNLSWDIKVTPARSLYNFTNRSIAREPREVDQKVVELMFTLTTS